VQKESVATPAKAKEEIKKLDFARKSVQKKKASVPVVVAEEPIVEAAADEPMVEEPTPAPTTVDNEPLKFDFSM
jgi:hypothetical protein